MIEAVFDLGLVPIGAKVSETLLESKTPVDGTLIPPARIPVAVDVESGKVSVSGQVLALDLIDLRAHITLTETQSGGISKCLVIKTAKEKKDSILKPVTDAIAAIGKKKDDSADKKE